MATHDQPRNGWTIVLRCQPARIVKGQAEGGYTDAYEIICCDCGDHPGLDYREVHRGFSWSAGQPDRGRRCRYQNYLELHQQPGRRHRPGLMADAS
jgi:hypothetical protein